MSTIGTNVGALNASFYLSVNNEALTRSIKKLAAGSRLAEASEDAAGVAVSGKLDANVKRLIAASEGAQNVISFAQTSDGFLKTVQEQLTRMSELAQRATNGAFGSADRANYNIEFTKMRDQIGTILSTAKFNGETLFAANNSVTVAISAQGDTDVFSKVSVTQITGLGLSGSTIGTTTVAISAIAAVNNALATITTKRAEVNADISKFNFHIQNIRTERINVEAANARIKDLDIASESTQLAKNNILLQASTSMLAQANASQQAVLSLLR
ncbi:MAG: flagellin [Verrucomicrobiota bacterium]